MENDKLKVWINNSMVPWKEATVPILSHGFSRGSAVFEAFGTHETPDGVAAFRMDMHLKRLEQTIKLLGMELKFTSDQIAAAVAETAAANNVKRGLVKIMAYWGEEAIINLVLKSKLDVAVFVMPSFPELGLDSLTPITASISKWRKLHPETVPVEAKACANYLNGLLIRKDANDRGFDVGISLGTDGLVAEGSIESVFVVKDGVLKTPKLGRVLASVTRNSIINAAKAEGIDVRETDLRLEDLNSADELFTCHTGIKVSPIRRFEDRELDAPGPLTDRLRTLMGNIMSCNDSRFKDWFQHLY